MNKLIIFLVVLSTSTGYRFAQGMDGHGESSGSTKVVYTNMSREPATFSYNGKRIKVPGEQTITIIDEPSSDPQGIRGLLSRFMDYLRRENDE